MQVRFTVSVPSRRWDTEMIEDVKPLVKAAVEEASREAAKVAAPIAHQRQRAGSHRKMGEITDLKTFLTETGYEGGIKSPAWYAYFQNDGTLGRRKKPLRQSTLDRRKSRSGQLRLAKVANNPGIKPLEFFDQAMKVGTTVLRDRLRSL